jgi:hypothetical protein
MIVLSEVKEVRLCACATWNVVSHHKSCDSSVRDATLLSDLVNGQSLVPIEPTYFFNTETSEGKTSGETVCVLSRTKRDAVSDHEFSNAASSHSDPFRNFVGREILAPVEALDFDISDSRDSPEVLGGFCAFKILLKGKERFAFDDATGQELREDLSQVIDAAYVQKMAGLSIRKPGVGCLEIDLADAHEVSDGFKGGEMSVAEVDVAVASFPTPLVITDRSFPIEEPRYVVPVHVDTLKVLADGATWR